MVLNVADMQLSPRIQERLDGRFTLLKTQKLVSRPAERDDAVVRRVTEMLTTIERDGIDAVRRYARELDGYESDELELDGDALAGSGDELDPELRAALELGVARTRAFAEATRRHLVDFEVELAPGIVTGVHYVPVGRVGAYLPAGRFPLLASASMTVNVAKVAGVPTVIGCVPPRRDGTVDPAARYAAYVAGVDRLYALGGVQALAAMAFGLLGDEPVDMVVGAGNAYVAEAKRQLFGAVAIDLLAGPSEVAVLADETADPAVVAADLLGQSEHGPESPSALVTTSEELGHSVIAEVERQLEELATRDVAGPAWRNYGLVAVAADREVAVELMDDLAPEHLEVQSGDDGYYFERLTNYGSVFLGPWSTVAYSDKGMAGTNHVLPTVGGARHSGGLSVSRFLKPLTFQRVAREATPLLARAVETISAYEGMAAHGATATARLARYRD